MKNCLVFILVLLGIHVFGQNSALLIEKEKNSYVFGQIFTDFRYVLNDGLQPRAAFNFNQGILGYANHISDNLRGLIMFDVTRTTHLYEITDTLGTQLNYNYFEGSKYTAYLKMAEIRWNISQYFTFRVGQLLNTQYLTFQDRFWGYRYIDVTFQEKFRLGMPADFGVQLDFKYKDKFLNQFSVVNGEGPFRHQDVNGKFIFSNNIQFNPTPEITVKLYLDYGASPDTASDKKAKSVISGFLGYKTERFRFAGEYVHIFNYNYNDGVNYSGFSFFSSILLSKNYHLLLRYDHLDMDFVNMSEMVDYYILGIQYEPVEKFTTSVNFRYYSVEKLPMIYASFGLKF